VRTGDLPNVGAFSVLIMAVAPLLSRCKRAINSVAPAFAVHGENDKANETTDDEQQNRAAGIDVHAAAKQDKDQSDGEECQQTTAATLDERRAFAITHGSRRPVEISVQAKKDLMHGNRFFHLRHSVSISYG
jgi:hypothetical protein